MGKEITRHNEFILKVFGDKQLATSFLRARIPADVQPDIDFSQLILKRLNPESVNDTLDRRRIADVLFQVPIKGKPGYLLVHIEHQSTFNNLTLLRANQYGLAALIDHQCLHPKDPLPPLLTIIYYHGDQDSSKYPTKMTDLLEDPTYAQYLFKPLLVDITQQSDEELLAHGDIGAIEFVLKHINDKPTPELADRFFACLEVVSSEMQYYSLQYIAGRLDLDNELLLEQALKHFDEDIVMNAAEQLRQQGEQRGIHKRDMAIVRRMLAKGQNIEFVSEMTGLSIKKIKRLKGDENE